MCESKGDEKEKKNSHLTKSDKSLEVVQMITTGSIEQFIVDELNRIIDRRENLEGSTNRTRGESRRNLNRQAGGDPDASVQRRAMSSILSAAVLTYTSKPSAYRTPRREKRERLT
jgi:hypothetical protein